MEFARLAYTVRTGRSNSGHLHTGETESPEVAQSVKLDSSATPTWCWEPGGLLESCWSSGHAGRPKKECSDVNEKWQWLRLQQDGCRPLTTGRKGWQTGCFFGCFLYLGCQGWVPPTWWAWLLLAVNPSWKFSPVSKSCQWICMIAWRVQCWVWLLPAAVSSTPAACMTPFSTMKANHQGESPGWRKIHFWVLLFQIKNKSGIDNLCSKKHKTNLNK